MFRKYLLPALAVAGVIFAIYSVVAGNKNPPAAQPVALPSQAPFNSYISGAGLIEASTENIAIGSHLSGIVTKSFVKVGSKVKTGDPLFQLDDRNLKAELSVRQAALKTAEARVNEAEASLQDVRSQLALVESLTDKRAISVEELNRRRFAVQLSEARRLAAQAEVASSRAQIKAAEVELERLTVRAPMDGEILQLNIRLGEFAQSGTLQRPLILLGNVDRLHVRVDIDENDAWRFRKNSPGLAFVRGNRDLKTPLVFERVEPFVVPKRSLTGDSSERVDTRVMQAIYSFERGELPIFVGQQMDVFIEAPPIAAADSPKIDSTKKPADNKGDNKGENKIEKKEEKKESRPGGGA
jgi:RND family efflux transporter MFP subunit